MNLSGFWVWLKPFLLAGIAAANAALVAEKPVILADVNALATKDGPAIANLVTSHLSFGGIFGGEVKSLVTGYIASEIPKLTNSLEASDGVWFDELVAKLEAEEKALGLA